MAPTVRTRTGWSGLLSALGATRQALKFPDGPAQAHGSRLISPGRRRRVCTLVRVLSYVLARTSLTRGKQTLGQMQGAAAACRFPLLWPKVLLFSHAMATSRVASWVALGAPLPAGLGHPLLETLSALILAMVRTLKLVTPQRRATLMLLGLQPLMRRMWKSYKSMTSGSGRCCLLCGVLGAPESTTRHSDWRPVGAFSAFSIPACELLCGPCLVLWAVGESTT